MIAYRVTKKTACSGGYADALRGQITATKQISAPLDQLERLDQTNIANVYSLFAVAVDHLTQIAPSRLTALASYYRALAAGAPWPAAFQQAFGISVPDYYTNFADYRAKL